MKVQPLRERPELAASFIAGFQAQWPAWYGPGGKGSAARDLLAFANRAGELPVGVVAVGPDGRPCGVAALKAASIPEYAILSPWAAAGYVAPELRGQGIGALLLDALVQEARRLGYNSVYCATATAGSLLIRKGWCLVEEGSHDGKAITLFRSTT